MRTVLVTGAGGAGRTTVAAATALTAARRGARVLLLGTDRDDTLGAALGTPAGAIPADPHAPLEAAPGLLVARVDAADDFRRELTALQERAATALDLLGATPLDTDELTELPGSEPFALLRALRTAPTASYDLVVVDMPPTHSTLAALALPGQLRRYVRRLLPPERQAARSLRPMLAQLAGVPMPAQWLYETTARWDAELAATQAVLESPALSVRLVVEPGPAAAETLRTARLGLALYGLALDAVVANRVLPTASPDPWLSALSAQQQEHLKEVHGSAHLFEVRELPHLGRAPQGPDELTPLSYEVSPASAVVRHVVEDRRAEDGVLVWHLPLPGATKQELGLVRRGDELVLTVGPFRRLLPLPSALRRCTVSGAGLTDGVLRVRFTPDPGLWPQGR
ncbi:ArsA family ATPase [Streptomyces sp. NBC_00237]|uniref:ArsA family ATPase n=1 Tax=Streptomyces sp. NBC_00237 TaxID=2975687 RepID=UPI002250423A|nr:ArsA-related P-loop ATPase [Streptomyces sp. NBC_00237]MCX5201735.1 ArsA family ATPase [Streptomyces sp. NBC_00237]